MLSLVDQLISSATNLLAVLLFAAHMDAIQFGVFSLAYAALTLFLGAGRTFFGLPISLMARTDLQSQHHHFSAAFGAVLLISPVISAVVFIVGTLGSNSAEQHIESVVVTVIAIAAPLVLLQDTSRYFAIASGRTRIALLSDALWFVGILILWFSFEGSSPILITMWLLIIAAATLIMVLTLKPAPSLAAAVNNLKIGNGIREASTLNVLLSNGTALAVSIIAAPFFGAQLIGSLRAAGTLFGPINTLVSFLDLGVLPRFIRLSGRQRIIAMTAIATLLGSIVIVWWLLLLWLPAEYGRLLLGDSWDGARRLLKFTGVEYVFIALIASFSLLFKVSNQSRPLFSIRLWISLSVILGTLVIVTFSNDGTHIAAILALGSCIGTILCIRATLKLRPHRNK